MKFLALILFVSTSSFAGYSKYYIDCSKDHGAYMFNGSESIQLDDKLPIPALNPGKTTAITLARTKTHFARVTRYANTFGIELIKIKTKKIGIIMGSMGGKLIDGNRFSADLQDRNGRIQFHMIGCYIRQE